MTLRKATKNFASQKLYNVSSTLEKLINYILQRVFYRKPAVLRWWVEDNLNTMSTDHNLLLFWTFICIGSMYHVSHEYSLLSIVLPYVAGPSANISICIVAYFVILPPAYILAEITSQIPGYMGLYDFCNIHLCEPMGYLSGWIVTLVAAFGFSDAGLFFASSSRPHLKVKLLIYMWTYYGFILLTSLAATPNVLRITAPAYILAKFLFYIFQFAYRDTYYWRMNLPPWHMAHPSATNLTFNNVFFSYGYEGVFRAVPELLPLLDGFIFSFLTAYFFNDPREYTKMVLNIINICTLMHVISYTIFTTFPPYWLSSQEDFHSIMGHDMGQAPTILPYWNYILLFAAFLSGGTKVIACTQMQYCMSKDYLHLLSIAHSKKPKLGLARLTTALLAITIGIAYPQKRVSSLHKSFISVYCIWLAVIFLIVRTGASKVRYTSTWAPVKLWTLNSTAYKLHRIPKISKGIIVIVFAMACCGAASEIHNLLYHGLNFLSSNILYICLSIAFVLGLLISIMPVYKPRRSYKIKCGNLIPIWVIIVHTAILCYREDSELKEIVRWLLIGCLLYLFIGVRCHYVYDTRWLYKPTYFEAVTPTRDKYLIRKGERMVQKLKKIYHIDI